MAGAEFFGCKITPLTMQDTIRLILSRVGDHEFTQHGAVNVAKLVNLQDDRALASAVNSCDIVSVDGMGVLWAARLLGVPVPERVTGVDLFINLLGHAAESGYPVYLLGATEQVLARTLRRVEVEHPDLVVAGSQHGYFDQSQEAEVVADIRRSGARLLFVAISSPTKETFIAKWQQQLGVDFVMGVGGSFDVYSGTIARAPGWMQSSGLEWLYRVLQEPRRMWRRYLSSNMKFALMCLRAVVAR